MFDPGAVQTALQSKAATGPCTACGKTNWEVEPTGFFLPAADGQSVNMGQGLAPIALVCASCGYLRFHVPHKLGL